MWRAMVRRVRLAGWDGGVCFVVPLYRVVSFLGQEQKRWYARRACYGTT